MQTSDLLATVPLFQLLDAGERADLERSFARLEVPAGETVFAMGEPGDSLYVVGTGRVELFVKDTTGSRIVLATCGPGELFGELSLFDGGARTASALVVEDATLLMLDRDDLHAFLRAHPDAALDLLTTMGQRIRTTDELLRRRVARNINEEHAIRSSTMEKAADLIAAFSGSIQFLLLNAAWFAIWIIWNTTPGVPHFDPYPFGFLTMVVSLEAIFLSIFVLVSQNRQGAKDRLRADAEYEVNLKAELEVMHLHEKVDVLMEELLARLPKRDRSARPGA
jgi:CRP/FNR family transcriptional regulator, cyclic AMP receptor protein